MIRGKNNNSKLTLQYAQKCLAFMGFKRNQRLNGRLLIGLLFPFLNVFLNIMFVLYEAKTFWEYTNSIFVCLVNSVGFLLFAILIVQVWRVFEIIDFGQTFFERSKYNKTDQMKRFLLYVDNIGDLLHLNSIQK